jgi:hypothetical protein
MTEDQKAAARERMANARAARGTPESQPEAGSGDQPVNAAAAPEAPAPTVELPAGPTLLERRAANEAEARQRKIDALKRAKEAQAAPPPEGVPCRVLKRGEGKISMGEHISGLGDLTYDKGETLTLPPETAAQYEDLGYVEIQ